MHAMTTLPVDGIGTFCVLCDVECADISNRTLFLCNSLSFFSIHSLPRSYHMSPEEVIKFCTDCVLSEEEGECDIPEGFYDQLRP